MIGENVLEGLPFKNEFIFDIHAHINDTSDFQMLDTAPAEVARTMDTLGITGACVSSVLSIHCDCARGNENVLAAVRDHPGKLYGYVTVSPHENDVDPAPFFAEPGFLGFKVHAAFHRTTVDDPRYAPFLEYANARSLPVLYHAWEAADCAGIAVLAKRYPQAKFIIGHGAMRIWQVKREAVAAVQHNENVFADTTVSMAYDGAIEDAAKRIGADRLCYGSDLPFYDCRHVLGKVATCRLPDADKRKILGENAKMILGLD